MQPPADMPDFEAALPQRRLFASTPGLSAWQRAVGVLALAAMMVYAMLAGWLWLRQEQLIFHPQPLPAEHRFDLGADVQELTLDVPGATLDALWLRLPHPRGVVFFLHGNNANLASWFVHPEFFRHANYDLFMIDYRGYGKSSGHIGSEAELHADVRAAWDRIAPRYAGLRRVVYGRSLGTDLAAALSAELQPELTVLVSPYRSMVALAHDDYPWVPSALLRYPLRTDAALAQVQSPVLLIHGDQDRLIPPRHSEELLALTPNARLLLVPGAGHGDIHEFDTYLQGLRSALDGL
jgi:pimeloyl-ACP methyl ester carboxylesterase